MDLYVNVENQGDPLGLKVRNDPISWGASGSRTEIVRHIVKTGFILSAIRRATSLHIVFKTTS